MAHDCRKAGRFVCVRQTTTRAVCWPIYRPSAPAARSRPGPVTVIHARTHALHPSFGPRHHFLSTYFHTTTLPTLDIY